ncbi:MAG: IclR family transcriptional regulator, regulon repressor [Candidatus Atribacteria bacterium]|uniref:IclR family transcriptional regulator n=1 Tax=Thermatribacter velox TaxID=3039681 RepID=A0ABZ2Y901_9BACT|nr:IclR family transcriptional regulator, regulon repressor [Candidatus Atribacteria bacterium]
MRNSRKNDTLKSVERALQILEAFTLDHNELSAAEIAQKTALPKGSIYRFLKILLNKGFLVRDFRSGKYRLGIKVFELGSIVWKGMSLRQVALPLMEELSRWSGETVHLGVRDGHEVVSIEGAESDQSLRIALPVGKRVCLHSTGIGKAILAFLSDEEIEEIIEKKGLPVFTPNTISTKEALWKEIKTIRERGYAVDNEENEPGIRCVAAPIRDYSGKVIASMSISGPSMRITDEKIPLFAQKVIETCKKVSRSLGYVGS